MGSAVDWKSAFLEDKPFNWEAWALDPAELVSFQKICSNLNGFGCGYLFWDCVDAHISREEMTAEAWIALVVRRYQFFLKHAPAEEVADQCPEVPAFYAILETLHERCLEIPSVVYTVSLEPAEDFQFQTRTRTMIGLVVSECLVPRLEPLKPWQHFPQPPYRIACDGNLYTFAEYSAYNGTEKSAWMWYQAPPCYEHVLELVSEQGEFLAWR